MKRLICIILVFVFLPLLPVSASESGIISLYMGENNSVLNGVGDSCKLVVYGVNKKGELTLINNSDIIWKTSDAQIVKIDCGKATAVNEGSYAVITDNIFADCPYPAQFQNNERNVGINGNERQQIDFWLRAYGKKDGSNEDWFNKLKSGGYFTDLWKEHYEKTVWKEYSNLFSLEFYEQNLEHLDKSADKDVLVEFARQYAPENANIFDRNIVYNTYKTQAVYSGSNSTETNTAPIEKQDFEDYNGMLSLFRKSDFLGCVK